MREIKKYVEEKKINNNVIRVDIGGEIKHYPISSFDYNISYHNSINRLYISTSQLTIKTNSSNLIFLLYNFTQKYNFSIGKMDFYGCFVTDYIIDNDNISEFTMNIDYLQIN